MGDAVDNLYPHRPKVKPACRQAGSSLNKEVIRLKKGTKKLMELWIFID